MHREQLLRMVLEAIGERVPEHGADILPDTPLGQDGLGLDSIAVLELVLELERRSGVVLRQESLSAAALESPASLVAYIESVSGG